MIRGYFGVRDWIPGFVVLGLSLVVCPKSWFCKETLILLLYLLVLVGFSLIGHTLTDLRWIANEIMPPLICLTIINLFLQKEDYAGLRLVTVLGLLIIVVTSLMTIPILLKDPDAVRKVVELGVGKGDAAFVSLSHKRGIASFGLVSSLPFIFPMLVYCVKAERRIMLKGLYLFTIAVTYLLLLKASIATPLIMSTMAILFSVIVTSNRGRNIVIGIIISLMLMFLLNERLVIEGLRTIQPMFSRTIIETKIDDIVLSLKKDKVQGSVSRSKLTVMSWNSFVKNPLYGGLDKKSAGGHAYFVDRLAYFGLVGAVPFFLYLYFTFRRHYALIDSKMKIYYLVGIFLFVLMGLVKNIGTVESFIYLFILLPGLCLINKKESSAQPVADPA
jgi:hypothetical protein